MDGILSFALTELFLDKAITQMFLISIAGKENFLHYFRLKNFALHEALVITVKKTMFGSCLSAIKS
jgi:hypothetical protein